MLGGEITDPHGVEGAARGLGLLPYTTELRHQKHYRHASHTLAQLTGFWGPLSGVTFDAYEIRHGHTCPSAASGELAARRLAPVLPENRGWQQGQTLALYLHGLLESSDVVHALFGAQTRTLNDTLNGLADFVEARFTPGTLMSLLE
jgi:adenosylcobyric acid synthase